MSMTARTGSEFGGREDTWGRVRTRLRHEAGEQAFNAWLKPLECVRVADGVVLLAVPTPFMKDSVQRLHGPRLLSAWRAEDSGVERVDIVVRAASAIARDLARRPDRAPASPAAAAAPAARLAASLPLTPGAGQDALARFNAPLDPRFTFDDFVVGKSNEFAYAAAKRVAATDDPPFNPLFLYGGVGLGKTHLMQAIAWETLRRKPGARVIYLSAERFMTTFINAMRAKSTWEFKETFRGVDLLLIDDVHFIAGKESTQEEFFHTFNALVDARKPVVLTADRAPGELQDVEERIRSRLSWGLVADVHQTDYELRLGILQAKLERAKGHHPNLEIAPKIVELLAQRIVSNVRELEGALTRVIAHWALVGRPITFDMVEDVLKEQMRACERRITIDEIQRRVCEHYALRMADMQSPRRARAVARPRQVAMYLCKQLTTRSLPEIGRRFGGRDHTTVIHAIKTIDALRAKDAQIDEDVTLLTRSLGG